MELVNVMDGLWLLGKDEKTTLPGGACTRCSEPARYERRKVVGRSDIDIRWYCDKHVSTVPGVIDRPPKEAS